MHISKVKKGYLKRIFGVFLFLNWLILVSRTFMILFNNSISDADDNFQDLGNFTNGIFNFRVYLQYVAREKKPICQATAYFLDPKSNSFYQLNLSMIVTDGNTVEDIFQVLKEKIVLILKGVKYRESV